MKRKIKIVIIVGVVIISVTVAWVIYQANNTDYQLNKLSNGTPNQKARAADFLTKKKVYEAIPLMIENISNNEVANIYGKAPANIYCVIFYDLEELVNNNFGFCSNEVINNDKSKQAIIDKWQNWYKNEYPQWLKEHQQN